MCWSVIIPLFSPLQIATANVAGSAFTIVYGVLSIIVLRYFFSKNHALSLKEKSKLSLCSFGLFFFVLLAFGILPGFGQEYQTLLLDAFTKPRYLSGSCSLATLQSAYQSILWTLTIFGGVAILVPFCLFAATDYRAFRAGRMRSHSQMSPME